MVHSRAQRFGGGLWVDVDFAAGDDAKKNAEHRCDSDQEAQAAPLDSLRSGHLLVHCFSFGRRHDMAAATLGARRMMAI
jgi:hypothetical protein